MATSSMLRSVAVKNKSQCRKLVDALEKSVKAECHPKALQKPSQDLSRKQIREIFGERS